MNQEKENSIALKFIENYFDSKNINYIPFPKGTNEWPDGLIILNNVKIAIEITELIHDKDKEYTNETILKNMEDLLSILLKEKIESNTAFRGQIDFDIDLENNRINTNHKARVLSESIFESIRSSLENINLHEAEILDTKIKFNQLNLTVHIISKQGWTNLTCNVGYKGRWICDIDSSYIQKVIDRKNETKELGEINEAWLILNEGFQNQRNKIHTGFIFETWYNRVFVLRTFGQITELKLNH